MAVSIQKIHDFVNFLRNEGQVQYFEPEQIDLAVNAAILDRFEEEVAEWKATGKMSDVLQSFKESETLALTSSIGDLTALANTYAYTLGFGSLLTKDFGSGNETVEYEGEIRDESNWNSRDLSDLVPDPTKPDNPLHWYQKELDITLSGGVGTLPKDFVKELAFSVTVDGQKYRGAIRSAEEWDRKSMEDIIKHRDTENPEDPFHWFKKKTSIALTTGEGDLPSDYVEPISVAALISGKEFEGEIRDLKDFFSKSLKDLIEDIENPARPLHWYEAESELTLDANGEVTLPDDFVQELGLASVISNKEYNGEMRDKKDFHRANAEDLVPDLENPDDPMHYYRKVAALTLTSDSASIPTDFIRPRAFSVVIGGKEYQGFLVKDDKWTSRSIQDLVPDEDNPKDPLHWYRKTATLSLTSGQATLPEDCVQVEEVAADVGGDMYEAEEVPRSKWNSRLRSVTVTPEEIHSIYKIEDDTIKVEPTLASESIEVDYLQYPVDKRPIARIGDGDIETQPSGLSNINLYYDAFPVEKHPVGTIANNTLYCLPKSLNDVRLYYYRFPVEQRPIAAFYDGKAKVEPVSLANINLYYYAFPVQKMPLLRVENSQIICDPLTNETIDFRYLQFPVGERSIARVGNDEIEVKPDTITSIQFYYLRKPAKAVYGYTISGDNRSFIFNQGASTDVDMPENTEASIASKTLEYLGVAMDDQALTQFNQFNKKGKNDQ